MKKFLALTLAAAMSLALVIKLEEQYGTIDTRKIRRLRG